MKTLILPVKREFFEQIKSSTKNEEYRLDNEFWRKRLMVQLHEYFPSDGVLIQTRTVPRDFDQVVITLGYPPKSDTSRRLVFPWRGIQIKTITHPHFGAAPVRVFAITLQAKP